MSVEKKISEALIRVGHLEGVVSIRDLDEIGISAGHFDDYLLAVYLGQLLERGEMEIKVAPSRIPYLMKLLHMDKGE